MENILRAERLIPHTRRMRLLERVMNPGPKELKAGTTVKSSWPLARRGSVSSLISIELMAQAVSALSTWQRGEGALPQPGLLVGIKEAVFFMQRIAEGAGLLIEIEELYHLAKYAVFKGRVISGPVPVCEAIIQVMESEQEYFHKLLSRGSRSEDEEKGN